MMRRFFAALLIAIYSHVAVAGQVQLYNPAGTLNGTDQVIIVRGNSPLTLAPMSSIWGGNPQLNFECSLDQVLLGMASGSPSCSQLASSQLSDLGGAFAQAAVDGNMGVETITSAQAATLQTIFRRGGTSGVAAAALLPLTWKTWTSGAPTPDNTGYLFSPSDHPGTCAYGCWEALYGPSIDPREFGVKIDGSTDDEPAWAALDSAMGNWQGAGMPPVFFTGKSVLNEGLTVAHLLALHGVKGQSLFVNTANESFGALVSFVETAGEVEVDGVGCKQLTFTSASPPTNADCMDVGTATREIQGFHIRHVTLTGGFNGVKVINAVNFSAEDIDSYGTFFADLDLVGAWTTATQKLQSIFVDNWRCHGSGNLCGVESSSNGQYVVFDGSQTGNTLTVSSVLKPVGAVSVIGQTIVATGYTTETITASCGANCWTVSHSQSIPSDTQMVSGFLSSATRSVWVRMFADGSAGLSGNDEFAFVGNANVSLHLDLHGNNGLNGFMSLKRDQDIGSIVTPNLLADQFVQGTYSTEIDSGFGFGPTDDYAYGTTGQVTKNLILHGAVAYHAPALWMAGEYVHRGDVRMGACAAASGYCTYMVISADGLTGSAAPTWTQTAATVIADNAVSWFYMAPVNGTVACSDGACSSIAENIGGIWFDGPMQRVRADIDVENIAYGALFESDTEGTQPTNTQSDIDLTLHGVVQGAAVWDIGKEQNLTVDHLTLEGHVDVLGGFNAASSVGGTYPGCVQIGSDIGGFAVNYTNLDLDKFTCRFRGGGAVSGYGLMQVSASSTIQGSITASDLEGTLGNFYLQGASYLTAPSDPDYGFIPAQANGAAIDSAFQGADAAAAALHKNLAVMYGEVELASTYPMESPLASKGGGMLQPQSGAQITLYGQPIASPQQHIFDISAGGTFVFNTTVAMPKVDVPWFWCGNVAATCSDMNAELAAASASVTALGAAQQTEIGIDGGGLAYTNVATYVPVYPWTKWLAGTGTINCANVDATNVPTIGDTYLCMAGVGSYGNQYDLQAYAPEGSNELIVATTDAANFAVGQEITVAEEPPQPTTAGSVGATDTTIVLTPNATGFRPDGVAKIEGELVCYLSITGSSTLATLTRGCLGTTAATHSAGVPVTELDFGIEITGKANSVPPTPKRETHIIKQIVAGCPNSYTSPAGCQPGDSKIVLQEGLSTSGGFLAMRQGVQVGYVIQNNRVQHADVGWNLVGNAAYRGSVEEIGFACTLCDYVNVDKVTATNYGSYAFLWNNSNLWRQTRTNVIAKELLGAGATTFSGDYDTVVSGDSRGWTVKETLAEGSAGGVTTVATPYTGTNLFGGEPFQGTYDGQSSSNDPLGISHFGFNTEGGGRDITVHLKSNSGGAALELQGGGGGIVADITSTNWINYCVQAVLGYAYRDDTIRAYCGHNFLGPGTTKLSQAAGTGTTPLYLADASGLMNGPMTEPLVNVDGELIEINAAIATLTADGDYSVPVVARGFGGTAAASHLQFATVTPDGWPAAAPLLVDTRSTVWPLGLTDPNSGLGYLASSYTVGAPSLSVNDGTQYYTPGSGLNGSPLYIALVPLTPTYPGQFDILSYTGVSGNTLTGVVGGLFGSTDASLTAGFVVPWTAPAVKGMHIAINNSSMGLPSSSIAAYIEGYAVAEELSLTFNSRYTGSLRYTNYAVQVENSNWNIGGDLYGYPLGINGLGNNLVAKSPTIRLAALDTTNTGIAINWGGNNDTAVEPTILNTYNGVVGSGTNDFSFGGTATVDNAVMSGTAQGTTHPPGSTVPWIPPGCNFAGATDTAGASETLVGSCTIPAYAEGNNSCLNIQDLWSRPATGQTVTASLAIKFAATAGTSGSAYLSGSMTSAQLSYGDIPRQICNNGSLSAQFGNGSVLGTNTSALPTSSVNTANPSVVNFTVKFTSPSGTDAATLNHATVSVQP